MNPIEIYGDGKQISDMVYVTDVAECLVNALEMARRHAVYEKAIEIGPAEHQTVNQIAELIIDLSGSKSVIKHIPMRPGEVPGSTVIADVSTLPWVGMNPIDFVSLQTGMLRTIEYFR